MPEHREPELPESSWRGAGQQVITGVGQVAGTINTSSLTLCPVIACPGDGIDPDIPLSVTSPAKVYLPVGRQSQTRDTA